MASQMLSLLTPVCLFASTLHVSLHTKVCVRINLVLSHTVSLRNLKNRGKMFLAYFQDLAALKNVTFT